MIGILFEGSKVDVLNKNAESPLHLAIRMMHADVAQLLVNHGNYIKTYATSLASHRRPL